MSEPCGHCGFKAGPSHKGNVVAETSEEFHEPYGEVTVDVIWSLSRCPNCEQPTLESYVWVDEFSDAEDTVARRIYPTAHDNSSLPPRVQQLLDAALRVKLVEPSFYAVGIRRTLEAVCRDRGGVGKDLDELLRTYH